MGYMDFNKVRYFDTREAQVVYYPPIPKGIKAIPSDSSKRVDSITLASGEMVDAQKRKEELEESQRHDRKLREDCI
jgi:hypothetical protein